MYDYAWLPEAADNLPADTHTNLKLPRMGIIDSAPMTSIPYLSSAVFDFQLVVHCMQMLKQRNVVNIKKNESSGFKATEAVLRAV